MNHSPLDRFLPNYFVRILVYSDSKKDWLPETIIPRPLGEFYPTDDRWFDPMAAFHFGAHVLNLTPDDLELASEA